MGASAREPARLAVAAPPSTQASSKAASESARFLGPEMKPPSSGSMKAAVMPARSKASIMPALPGVHSWVLRSPAATNWATVPRATSELYRRVATRTLLDPASDRLLAKLLATEHTHDRLPRLLVDEPGRSWAGKTGSYGGVRNDSGILTTKKGRFVLVAFADRIPDTVDGRARAIRAMGDIAAAIVNEWSSSLPDLEPVVEPPLPPVLMPPVPRAEMTLAEARANPDALHLDRVFRDTDRRFWDLWRAAGGDVADACLIPMPNSWGEGYEPFKIEPISALVLHHTAQATDEECIALFEKPESKVSSHFLVGRDGRLFQFVSLEHRAWHAGVSLLHGRMALNRTSVGV